MYLDSIVAAQKQGEARGIVSVCSANPYVLKQTLKAFGRPLIEATCNQVNQFGGYTGMTPTNFVRYVRGIAEENSCPFENVLLGGDHLGPSIWQGESAEVAMRKADVLVHDYVEAGFVKIHLDCSMRLADDHEGPLDVEVSAERAARLARVAEQKGKEDLRYVIGTEVPIPGGAKDYEEYISVTKVEDARQTIEVTREAFYRVGLESAWERVIAVVVQPGVEFGDDFILPYQPEATGELSKFIEIQPMVYEAHSTDYQTRQALKDLVRDHFAILKVGPALTFAFREAVFALAEIENELFAADESSNIISILDDVMVQHPEYWARYYMGSMEEQAFKRKYSLSDRIRYYWTEPKVQHALNLLLTRLAKTPLPETLLKQYVPEIYASSKNESRSITPERILLSKIQYVLDGYYLAVTG
jgi:D-tagatose-1,6-bisphosphate aldolase subunit GatZ/KbaZ